MAMTDFFVTLQPKDEKEAGSAEVQAADNKCSIFLTTAYDYTPYQPDAVRLAAFGNELFVDAPSRR